MAKSDKQTIKEMKIQITNLRKSASRLHYLSENRLLLIDNYRRKMLQVAKVLESVADMPYSRSIAIKKYYNIKGMRFK